MAKTFYYDSVGLLESTIAEGSVTGGSGNVSIFSSGDSIVNPEATIDQSVLVAPTGWGQNEIAQYTLSSAKAVDFLAVYFNAEETDDIDFEFDSANSGISDGEAVGATDTFSTGWTVFEFTEQTKQYWRIISKSAGGITGLTEIIFGKKLAFEINPDIGISEIEEFGTDVNTSIGGVEYAIKRHEPKSTFSMNFSNISQAFKNNLQSMEAQVQNYKKFIYSEDGTSGTFHYVRLESPIQFEEVAYQRYSASFTLREQLS
tara:strand:- start:792 stop:1568 length:777 start_codon:yes stop_codon:yes gene_type:complete